MSRTSSRLAALAAAALASCTSSSGGGAPAAGVITLTASPLSAIADGFSTVVVHVAGGTQGPVSLSTSRAVFSYG